MTHYPDNPYFIQVGTDSFICGQPEKGGNGEREWGEEGK